MLRRLLDPALFGAKQGKFRMRPHLHILKRLFAADRQGVFQKHLSVGVAPESTSPPREIAQMAISLLSTADTMRALVRLCPGAFRLLPASFPKGDISTRMATRINRHLREERLQSSDLPAQ